MNYWIKLWLRRYMKKNIYIYQSWSWLHSIVRTFFTLEHRYWKIIDVQAPRRNTEISGKSDWRYHPSEITVTGLTSFQFSGCYRLSQKSRRIVILNKKKLGFFNVGWTSKNNTGQLVPKDVFEQLSSTKMEIHIMWNFIKQLRSLKI